MGKGDRNKAYKASSRAVAQARGDSGGGSGKTIAGIAVVVVLALAVAGGVYYTYQQTVKGEEIQAVSDELDAPATLTDGVVTVGKKDAPVKLDLYEDFQCPACKSFEASRGEQIDKAIASGKVQAKYHVLNILNTSSEPDGYSTDAGNAALCAAEADKWSSYKKSLFKSQPDEGSRGHSPERLAELGTKLGLGADFKKCVTSGAKDGQIDSNTATAASNKAVAGPTGLTTPTVLVNGEKVNRKQNRQWLQQALQGAGSSDGAQAGAGTADGQ